MLMTCKRTQISEPDINAQLEQAQIEIDRLNVQYEAKLKLKEEF